MTYKHGNSHCPGLLPWQTRGHVLFLWITRWEFKGSSPQLQIQQGSSSRGLAFQLTWSTLLNGHTGVNDLCVGPVFPSVLLSVESSAWFSLCCHHLRVWTHPNTAPHMEFCTEPCRSDSWPWSTFKTLDVHYDSWPFGDLLPWLLFPTNF